MLDSASLIQRLTLDGVDLDLSGGVLRFRGRDGGAVSDETKAIIRANREAITAELVREARDAANPLHDHLMGWGGADIVESFAGRAIANRMERWSQAWWTSPTPEGREQAAREYRAAAVEAYEAAMNLTGGVA